MEETITWEDLPRLMTEVRTRAHGILRRDRDRASLQTTELVDTAIRRLAPSEGRWSDVTWRDQDHFLATLYRAMQSALYDHAKSRLAKKRDVRQTVRLEDLQVHDLCRATEVAPEQVIALKEAIEQLEKQRPAWATIMQYRLLGLTIAEIAQARGMSEITVKRAWTQAQRWCEEEVLRHLNEA